MLPNDVRYDQVIIPDYINPYRKEYTGLKYADPEDYNYVSRYSLTRRIFDKNNIEYHETYNMKEIPERSEDNYFRIDNTTINRLDLVSYRVYGFSIYWWVIAMANDMIDPFNVPLDTVLRIPPISSLYITGSVLANG